MAFAAERFFGIADITGAYVAGIILCSIRDSSYIERKVDINSYMKYTDSSNPTESPFWDTIRATSPLVIIPTPTPIILKLLYSKDKQTTWYCWKKSRRLHPESLRDFYKDDTMLDDKIEQRKYNRKDK